MTLHFGGRRGAASFRDRNHAEITALMCVGKTEAISRYGFRAGGKVIWYSVKGHRFESIWGNSDNLLSHPFHLHIKHHSQ